MGLNQDETAPKKSTEAGATHSSYSVSKLLLVLGLGLLTMTNIFYAENSAEFFISGSSPFYPLVSLTLLLAGAICLGGSAVLFLSAARKSPSSEDPSTHKISWRTEKILADVLFNNFKLELTVAIAYGMIFALLDGIFIYQPTVDFSQAYAVHGLSSTVSFCCGLPGFIPVFSIYFPDQHAGFQLIPLNLLLMVITSMLVALNVSLLYSATRLSAGNSQIRGSFAKRSGGGSLVGATLGLFAGCPTCAAAFFLSMLLGSGATALSAFVSQYQPLIIGMTLPVLIGSLWYQSKSIRIIMQGCSV